MRCAGIVRPAGAPVVPPACEDPLRGSACAVPTSPSPQGDPRARSGTTPAGRCKSRQAGQRGDGHYVPVAGTPSGNPAPKPQGSPEVSPPSLPFPAHPRPRCAGHDPRWHRQDASACGTTTVQAETRAGHITWLRGTAIRSQTVGGHQDLPSDRHELAASITELSRFSRCCVPLPIVEYWSALAGQGVLTNSAGRPDIYEPYYHSPSLTKLRIWPTRCGRMRVDWRAVLRFL